MNEERKLILDMIAKGTITAEEGERLLDALNGGERGNKGAGRGKDWSFGADIPPFDNFEKMMEKFGEELEHRAEQWAEGFGREMEGFFGGWGDTPRQRGRHDGEDTSFGEFSGEDLPGWSYDSSRRGETMESAGGRLDFSSIDGLIVLGASDIGLSPSEDDFCAFDEGQLAGAVRRGTWAVLTFSGDTELTVPVRVGKIALSLNRGDALVNGVDGELWIKVNRGDIGLNGIRKTLWALSLSGDVEAGLEADFEGKASLNSLRGDIACRLSSASNVEFTARSIKGSLSAGGAGLDVKGQYRKPGNVFMTGSVGSGERGYLTAETTNGDVDIRSVLDA